jgi:hypothetical protein
LRHQAQRRGDAGSQDGGPQSIRNVLAHAISLSVVNQDIDVFIANCKPGVIANSTRFPKRFFY